MKKTLALAIFGALCIAQPAMAEKTGFYVGADIGQMSADINKGNLDLMADEFVSAIEDETGIFVVPGTESSDLDDSDTTFALTVGYRFMPYLAVEAQYLDLGAAEYNATADFTDGFDVGTGTLTADVDSSGFALSVLGILPIQEVWEVYARLGMYFGDTDSNIDFSATDGVASESVNLFNGSKSESEFLYGIGAGYTFNETWNIRVEYTVIQDIGDEEITSGEGDVDRLVIGVNYMF